MLHDLNNFREDVGRWRGCGIILGLRRLDRHFDFVRIVLRAVRHGRALGERCVEATVEIIEAPSVGSCPGCRRGKRPICDDRRSSGRDRRSRARVGRIGPRGAGNRIGGCLCVDSGFRISYAASFGLGSCFRGRAFGRVGGNCSDVDAWRSDRELERRDGHGLFGWRYRRSRGWCHCERDGRWRRRGARSDRWGIGWRNRRRRGDDRREDRDALGLRGCVRDDLRKFGTPRTRATRDGFRCEGRSRWRRQTKRRLRSGRRLRRRGARSYRWGIGWRYRRSRGGCHCGRDGRRRGDDRREDRDALGLRGCVRDDLRKFGTPRTRATRDGFRCEDRSRWRHRTKRRLRSGRRLRDHGGERWRDGRRDALLHGTILRESKRSCGGFFRLGSARRQKCANYKKRESENVHDDR